MPRIAVGVGRAFAVVAVVVLVACSGDSPPAERSSSPDTVPEGPGPPCGGNVVAGEAPGGLLAWSTDEEDAVIVHDLDGTGRDAQVEAEEVGAARLLDPDLSPDGRVAFRAGPARDSDAADVLWRPLGGGGAFVHATNDPAGDNWGPSWSPDGERIAFSSTRDSPGRPRVWTANPDGSDLRLETDGHGEYPDWSPDGSQIVYAAPDLAGRYDLFTATVGGGAPVHLVASDESDFFPAWSPDGALIAFHRISDDGGVFVVPADGSGPEQRVSPDGAAGDPVWAPDGRLGWASPAGFVVTDLDACSTVRLDIEAVGRFPSWVP